MTWGISTAMYCLAWLRLAGLYWVVLRFLVRLLLWKYYPFNQKTGPYHFLKQLFIQDHGSGILSVEDPMTRAEFMPFNSLASYTCLDMDILFITNTSKSSFLRSELDDLLLMLFQFMVFFFCLFFKAPSGATCESRGVWTQVDGDWCLPSATYWAEWGRFRDIFSIGV